VSKWCDGVIAHLVEIARKVSLGRLSRGATVCWCGVLHPAVPGGQNLPVKPITYWHGLFKTIVCMKMRRPECVCGSPEYHLAAVSRAQW
jgi:hypothetical protein